MGLRTRESIEMKGLIIEALLEKNEGKTITIMDKFPPITQLQGCFLGTHSLTGLDKKWRYLKRDSLIDIGGIVGTQPELARIYLGIKYGNKSPRINRWQRESILDQHFRAPAFARPGQWGQCSYVDIVGAYWNILKTVGWDVDYHPGRYVGQRSEMFDFPFEDYKLSRNALAVAGVNHSLTIWTGKEIKSLKSGGKLRNKIIFAYIMDVLNGIAHELAFECGAVYCLTDGFIIPDEHVWRARQIIDSWGLASSVKHQGDTHVKGVGSYRIGQHTSKPYLVSDRERAVYAVDPRSWEWLKFRSYMFSQLWTRQAYAKNAILKDEQTAYTDPTS